MNPSLKQRAIWHTVRQQNPFGNRPLIPLPTTYRDRWRRWLHRPPVQATRLWLNTRIEHSLTLIASLLGLSLGLIPVALFYLGLSYLFHVVLQFDPTPSTSPTTLLQGVTYEMNWYLVDMSLLCLPLLLLLFPLAFMFILAQIVRGPFARGRALTARWACCENNYPEPLKPVVVTPSPFLVRIIPFTAYAANFIVLLTVVLLLLYRAYILEITGEGQESTQSAFSLCCFGWPFFLTWQIPRTVATIRHFTDALFAGSSYFQALQEGWDGFCQTTS